MLRARITEAAAASGYSISEEVELRLIRSFYEDGLYQDKLLEKVKCLLAEALEPLRAKEAPVDKRLTLLYRPPFAVRSAIEPVIVDADGEPIALALSGPTASTRMLLAEAIAAGLNAQCGVPAPAVTNRFDPHHEAATRAESRQQAARMNSFPRAAE